MSARQTRSKSKSRKTQQTKPSKVKSSKQELSSHMSELAGQKKMMEFLGKEKPSTEEQKGDKATTEAMPGQNRKTSYLLNNKIDRKDLET